MAINDDRRIANFRSGRRVSTIGDRREPVVLARSTRVPDTMSDDPVGWIQNYQPYARTWAAINFREKRVFDGTDVDEQYVHLFYILDDPDISIQERDVIVWRDEIYVVLTTRLLGHRAADLMIRAKYSGRTDGARFENGAIRGANTTAPAPVAAPDRSGDAFWSQLDGETES